MNRVFKAALLVGGVAAGAAVYALADKSIDGPKTVDAVDLERYAGQWFEIARYPNRFQRNCSCDVTATYTVLPKGRIGVVNTCRNAKGGLERIRGTATVADRKTNARLRVSFFWPLAGDYWILELGREYEFAVVSDPRLSYLWVLGRTPQMDEAVYQRIVSKLESRGIDTAKLVRTRQTGQGYDEDEPAAKVKRAR